MEMSMVKTEGIAKLIVKDMVKDKVKLWIGGIRWPWSMTCARVSLTALSGK